MASPRKRKRKQGDVSLDEVSSKRSSKGCDRKSCLMTYCDPPPFCFCHATEKCAKDGHTSRWYHLSAGQHYCNECFEHFYRSHKPGHKLYEQWSSIWEREAGDTLPPRASQFMADMWLPIWVQCTNEGCGHWRKLPAHIELHHVKLDVVKCSDCSLDEDPIALMAMDPLWVHSISYSPLLRYCEPLASLLVEYYPDGVGISPTTVCIQRNKQQQQQQQQQQQHEESSTSGGGIANGEALKKEEGKEEVEDTVVPSYDWLHPFNHPKEGPRGGALTPDTLEPCESKTFPEWSKSPALDVYLIMRNIALSLWYSNNTQLVTASRCMDLVRLRGTVRIWISSQYERVIHFLSRRGYINCGLLSIERPLASMHSVNKQSVIIIGGGPSGLSAARHLANFDYQVTILEASNRIGGRVHDVNIFGQNVGQGAMFITGVINNPLTLLSRQRGYTIRLVKEDKCELILERSGLFAEGEVDKRVEKQFNASLDRLAEWRNKNNNYTDDSLENKLSELHSQLLTEEGYTYTQDERGLFDFHLSNLEFACGAHLSEVSACHWDHNDAFPQFGGAHALVQSGLAQLVRELLPVETQLLLNSQVCHIDASSEDNPVIVKCRNGNEYTADKVIVTVPLSILKDKTIKFTPSLSPAKQKAIERIGAGLVEKVTLTFKTPFWKEKIGNADIFGHIPLSTEKRGLFSVLYDISPVPPTINDSSIKNEGPVAPTPVYMLMMTVSGEALKLYYTLSETEIKDEAISVLKFLFPDQTVQEPVSVLCSRWGNDPFVKMSYSYVCVGGASEDYDVMSEEEGNGRIHFAGEATNRWYPQSVTGAYISGVREACKIIESDFFSSKIHNNK
ncbi:PREDICTED: lysine-specific histone demethylase 1B-like [Amphimedon queenslandica]|uniref:SWIRM domain-containing protein n=1 Tax=Amphimedon queenslandica TaxID=400682 RepID=A0A1X7V9E8_AMPQE|nr:PREDICTED: lysine-specific histone demethylase 1B-like [Amphimedon queenslandica]|eukprot:XP_019850257.1 PREDICTED: lysine-specific histone demethylase 1B-like [Amphimedon queenslandica]